MSGLAVPQLRGLYNYGWFVGFSVSFLAYLILMRGRQSRLKIEAASSTARSL